MPSPDYLPLAADLPAVYQEDQAGFRQLESYLSLADALAREGIATLEDAERWLSPECLDLWPPGLGLDAGPDAVRRAHLAVQDELAAWTGFTFPPSWPVDDSGLVRRRTYLRQAARLWRRRGTPAGFLDWFGLAFADALGGLRPQLVEHFRVADPVAPETAEHDPWLRATLFVRGDDATPGDSTDRGFADFGRRREAIAFVDRYAPAHVHVRVCWIRPDAFSLGTPPDRSSTQAQIAAWQESVREVLCSLVSFVDHALGIRIWECVDEGRAQDRLGVGRLPGGGTT